MSLTEEHIAEIAEELESGMICFYHRPTGEIVSHPDPDDPYFEAELWQETLDKIEEDRDNYQQFEKMDSRQEFRLMEDFADSLTDSRFQDSIFERLSKPKPFQNFKNLIDSSNYRQAWFDFKKQAYIDFVKRQLETNQ
jgi:hypothetical protein